MTQLIFFIILGSLIHLGFKFKQAFEKSDFELKIFIKKNVVGSILAILTGLAIVLLKDDISTMFGISINNFMALFIGYTGDSMFKQLMKNAKTATKSKINAK